MSITRIQTNARMSQIVIGNGVAYLAGQLPLPGEGNTTAEQVQILLNRIEGLLAEASSDKSRLLSATIWLRDINDFDAMNAVWEAWLPENCAPARACIETRFPMDHVHAEIQVTALQDHVSHVR